MARSHIEGIEGSKDDISTPQSNENQSGLHIRHLPSSHQVIPNDITSLRHKTFVKIYWIRIKSGMTENWQWEPRVGGWAEEVQGLLGSWGPNG